MKRIYIPLPDEEGRLAILTHLLTGECFFLRPLSRRTSRAGRRGEEAALLPVGLPRDVNVANFSQQPAD